MSAPAIVDRTKLVEVWNSPNMTFVRRTFETVCAILHGLWKKAMPTTIKEEIAAFKNADWKKDWAEIKRRNKDELRRVGGFMLGLMCLPLILLVGGTCQVYFYLRGKPSVFDNMGEIKGWFKKYI
jgi:hypothetical protein